MRKNLDVFSMCPSVEPAGRRFASLDRVLRGEFPWFIGTIKALRLPAAHPAALRCLRVVVPLAILRDEAGDPAGALPLLERARGLRDELVTASPVVSRFQNGLANCDNSLGIVQFRLGRRADSYASHQRARDRWERLVRANPKVIDYKNRLAAA
jgi:hypothetical protein